MSLQLNLFYRRSAEKRCWYISLLYYYSTVNMYTSVDSLDVSVHHYYTARIFHFSDSKQLLLKTVFYRAVRLYNDYKDYK